MFNDLKLIPEVLRAIEDKGYKNPSEIQKKAIPLVLDGKDVMAAAQTGTGKTAAFTLPILDILARGNKVSPNKVRALILTPTRELAAQIGANIKEYSKYLRLSSLVVFGGVKINPQLKALRYGADILVATPGRLLDLLQQNAVKFDELEILVLDEADRMLDMGFIHDIKRLIKKIPKVRQNLLFSATFSNNIRELAKTIINRGAIEVSVSPRNTTKAAIQQIIHPVDKAQKSTALISLIIKGDWKQVLIFTRTKHGANKLTKQLIEKGINAAAIHGNKSQGARTKALVDFKSKTIKALVATDIAARGLDIEQLPQVVNFDLPNIPDDYVHRIGRTGRAGLTGHAISLVCADEFEYLFDIENLIGKLITREYLEAFDPSHALPESYLGIKKRSFSKKKPIASQRGSSSNFKKDYRNRKESSEKRRVRPTSKNRDK